MISSKNLYFVKIAEVKKAIDFKVKLINKDNMYYIAEKIDENSYMLISKEKIAFQNNARIEDTGYIVYKALPLCDVLEKKKFMYSKKSLLKIESDIQNFQDEFKASKTINGCETHLAK
ncbi:MAG: hypothetical protein IJW25_01540 [Clostridia bacterium]|nr:hypothetical protein [Clostridia bacterium]